MVCRYVSSLRFDFGAQISTRGRWGRYLCMRQRVYWRLGKIGWGASSFVLTKCHYGQKTKENEMGRTCGTHWGRWEMRIVRKHEGKKPLGRPKHRPQETLNGSFLTNRKWIGLTCHRTRISSRILRVAQNARNLSTRWATINFSRKGLAPCGYFGIQGVDSRAVYKV
jgi:hypothetical protein